MKSLLRQKPFAVPGGAILICFLFLGFLAAAANAQTQQIVLTRGNNWQPGIPGFGGNMFSALFGEYDVETINSANRAKADRAAAKIGGFSVRASRERLHFDERLWKPRPGIAAAMQRNEDGFLLIGLYLDNPDNTGSWAIVFQFSQSLSGMDDAAINRLIRAWNGRFSYFLSLAKNYSEVSLPAALVF